MLDIVLLEHDLKMNHVAADMTPAYTLLCALSRSFVTFMNLASEGFKRA